jgi:hypothetical protein
MTLSRKTAQGFADPAERQALPGEAAPNRAPAAAAPPAQAEPAHVPAQPVATRGGAKAPLIEVEVTYERGPLPRAEPVRRTFEIWTQNTVYGVDSRMYCVEVRNPATATPLAEHPFLGARLVGGTLQGEAMVEMSYPLPRPGAFAVFESKKGNKRKFSRTSRVERVVLRMRVVTITGTDEANWDDLLLDG